MKYSSSRPQLFVLIRVIRGLLHNVDSRHTSVFIRPECDAETHSGLPWPYNFCVLCVFRGRNNHRSVWLSMVTFVFLPQAFFCL